MKESMRCPGPAHSFCEGKNGWRQLVSQTVLATVLFLFVGCTPRPSPGNPPPPLVIFFVNGAQLTEVASDSIWEGISSARKTDSVRVLKGPRALAQYGEKGKNGVVLIYLREGQIKEGSAGHGP